MRFFIYFKPSLILALAVSIGLAAACVPALWAANPLMVKTTVEVTLDSFDSAGDPSEGYTFGAQHVRYSLGEPCAVTRMSIGTTELQSGYYGQDLIGPSHVTSIWRAPGMLPARSIVLQWVTPGDNERDDAILAGSRIHISTTTEEADAESESFWTSKRDAADIIITTGGVNSQSIVSYRITGLAANTTYYMRIWSLDQAANWSDLSAGGTTYAEPVILSVYVVDPSTYNFGVMETNVSTTAGRGIIVRNDGNTTENYYLRIDTINVTDNVTDTWEAGSTPYFNRFVLYTVFKSSAPEDFNYSENEGDDILTRADIAASEFNFTDGIISGTTIPAYIIDPILSETSIWFKLTTPLNTTTTGQQIINTKITAYETP